MFFDKRMHATHAMHIFFAEINEHNTNGMHFDKTNTYSA